MTGARAPRRAAESLRLRIADAADAMLGRRDQLTPPRRLRGFVGDSDFQETGEELVGRLHQLAGLTASDRVLDVGCGIGRIARVLVPELRPPGSYDGFDVVAEAIAWCQERYRETAVPFRFAHADIQNTVYNPSGTGSASRYRFPYADASFDLVVATSVFTHLLGDAADRYLAEVARVLVSGGRLFATWLLLAPGRSVGVPLHEAGAARVFDPAAPEAAAAYDEGWVRERLTTHGLALREPIHWGTWAGGAGISYQDLIVADAR